MLHKSGDIKLDVLLQKLEEIDKTEKSPQPVKCFLVVFLKQPAPSDERPVADITD